MRNKWLKDLFALSHFCFSYFSSCYNSNLYLCYLWNKIFWSVFCEIKVLKTFPRETYWSNMFGRWHTLKSSLLYTIVPMITLKPLRKTAIRSFRKLQKELWINSCWPPTKPECHGINFRKGWLFNKLTSKRSNHYASFLLADI